MLAVNSPAAVASTSDTLDSASATRTLRVLHVINGEHYSGAERVQDLLGQCLPQFGVEAGFACVKPGKFVDAMQARDCPLYLTPMGSRLDIRAGWRLAKIIRDDKYDLVHAHTPRSLMAGRIGSSLAGVPLVYHVHSPTARDTTHALRNWFNATAERWSLSGVARLICVSQSLRRQMIATGFDPALVSVVPNGVPRLDYLPARAAPTANWTLGTVALFRPRKGLEVLLDALAELRHEGHAIRLRAVGPFETPAYEAAIRRQVAERNIGAWIDWVGFTREVTRELLQMDLFVLPSLFGEGLPMVVLEAMAAGTPVIGTEVEGVPEAVRDGLDGLIAPPGDAKALARTILRVIRGEVDWNELRASALSRQAALFSDVSMAAGVAAVYRSVLH